MTAEQPTARRATIADHGVSVSLIAAALGLSLLARAAGWPDRPAFANWLTVFVAVTLQAFPFLMLGVAISASISVFVPTGAIQRVLPKRPFLAVPVAGAAGAALPGCECGSVPIAGRLVATGTPGPAALAFLLSAPAINPVVLVATAVAFPDRPELVLARLLASFATAVVVGWLWTRQAPVRSRTSRHDATDGRTPARRRSARWVDVLLDDFLHTAGYLVVGAAGAATLQTVVPRSTLDALAGNGLLAIVVMAALAIVLAVCSEADAFVASGLSQFSLTARLVFLVVGPVVDVKLIAMQVATFGRPFTIRFASTTLVVAVTSATLFGWALL